MKKLYWAFLLLFFVPKFSYSAITDPQVLAEKTYVVHLTTTVAANTLSIFDLIDLSSTGAPTPWPHSYANPSDKGEIDISEIRLVIDKVAAATTTVKMGVVDYISASTGSVNFFFSRSSLLNVSNTDTLAFSNYQPSFYRCKVYPKAGTEGLVPYIFSGDTRNGSTLYRSDVLLNTPVGTVYPNIGDIVLELQTGTASINYIIDVWYHAEP